jgi:DNA anti-recombination protein RmuC
MTNILIVGIPLFLASSAAIAAGGWTALLSDGHTMFFVGINVFLTFYFVKIRFDRFAVVHGPEILTTLGIFGCFVGIALALLDFDTNDVQNSVPNLLDGVKTAFWASVSGVFGSLVIRARHKFQKAPIEQAAGTPKSSSLDDVVVALQGLKTSLTGQDQDTLISQLKMLRQDQSDSFKSMRESLDNFAKQLSEQSSKTLVEALRDVIRDFNHKLSEQFGENFKQLNMAVGDLLKWQNQYKDHLEKLQEVQKNGAKNLQEASQNLLVIVNATKEFSTAAAQIYQLSKSLAEQAEKIDASQKSLADILSGLKDTAPKFEAHFKQMTTQISDGIKAVQGEMSSVSRAFAEQSKQNLEQVGRQLDVTVSDFGSKARDANESLARQLGTSLEENQKSVNSNLIDSVKKVQDGVSKLESSLENELNRSLQALGNQLASLSSKFVSDYSPLTDKLREVVRLAEVVASESKDRRNGN